MAARDGFTGERKCAILIENVEIVKTCTLFTLVRSCQSTTSLDKEV